MTTNKVRVLDVFSLISLCSDVSLASHLLKILPFYSSTFLHPEQKKAETYYTHANVKNRNKDKDRETEKTKSDVGRARAGKRGGPTSGNKKVRLHIYISTDSPFLLEPEVLT
jgi:hypothetical protein